MWQKIKQSDIWGIVILFVIWRIGLFIVAYFAYFRLPEHPQIFFYPDLHPLFSMWLPYDSTWFIDIAQKGYGFDLQSTAFFPLWPLLIFLASKILFFVDGRIIAFILANLATLGVCLMLYKLVKEEYSKEIAQRSVKYLLFFPMSLFLATAYSEPLFLLLILASFYFAKKKKWLAAGFFGLCAATTRLVGFLVFIPLLIELIGSKYQDKVAKYKNILLLLLVPAGLVLYMLYLKTTLGDGLAFLHAYHNNDWGRSIGFGAFHQLYDHLKIIFSFSVFEYSGKFVTAFIEAGVFLLFLLILLINYKRISLSYFVYGTMVICLPLFSGTLISLNRYALAAFPVFIILAQWGQKKWFDELITIIFLLLLGLFTAMFVNGWWVG